MHEGADHVEGEAGGWEGGRWEKKGVNKKKMGAETTKKASKVYQTRHKKENGKTGAGSRNDGRRRAEEERGGLGKVM